MTLPTLRERAGRAMELVRTPLGLWDQSDYKIAGSFGVQWMRSESAKSATLIAALCRVVEAHRAYYALTVDADTAVDKADAALDALLKEVDDGR